MNHVKKIIFFFIYISFTSCDKILMFGGNGFIGSHILESLRLNKHEITLVNRGHEYFDSDARTKIFTQYKCDRNKSLREACPELISDVFYDVVIDCSSYRSEQIMQLIDVLHGRVGIFIYLSTDAIYEHFLKGHENPTREIDSLKEVVSHENSNIKTNNYGKNKHACEEELDRQRRKSGFPFVILRIATAIGERDTTMRWWIYQLLVKLHQSINIPIPLPKEVAHVKFSMSYAKDVGVAILAIIKNKTIYFDQMINIAFREHLDLSQILYSMSDCLNITDIKLDKGSETAWFKYPTVTYGPLDISKLKNYGWKMTPFKEAALKTCEFFENAMTKHEYADEKAIMIAELLEECLPDTYQDENILFGKLIEKYGRDVMYGLDLEFNDGKQYSFDKKHEL